MTGDEVAPGHRHQDEEEVEDEAGEPDVSLVRLPVQVPQTQDSHQQTLHHQSIFLKKLNLAEVHYRPQ